MIGIAFSVAALVNFGKAGLKAASETKAAFIGLQSIVEGQGRSFERANEFIQEYISDGLIPARDAVTAYKNLAMRGYGDDQIVETMIRLKDAAAFGRQASLTLGEAVSSATEGLKNENSILVDNAGVTKNVSMMWKDYAASIGTTVGMLTKQQKIQAEVLGIMEETRFQTGDAAKVAGTYQGAVTQLGFAFYNLKVAVGNAIMPIAQVVIPVISNIITWFTKLFNTIAAVTQALFGIKPTMNSAASAASGVADSTGAAAGATGDLAKETKAAGKAAKGSLASWDELENQMSSTAGASEAAADALSAGAGAGGGISFEKEAIEEPRLEWLENLRKLLEPATIAFQKFIKALDPLKKFAAEAFSRFYKDILVPLAKWTISEVIPRFFETLSTWVHLLGSVLLKFIPMWDDFYAQFLKPVAEAFGKEAMKNWDDFNQKFKDLATLIENSKAFEDLRTILSAIWDVLRPIVQYLIEMYGILDRFYLNQAFIDLKYVFIDLEDRLGFIAALIRGDFSDAWEHLKDLLIDNRIDKAREKIDAFKETMEELRAKIREVIDYWKEIINELVESWKTKITTWWNNDVAPWFTLEKWKALFFRIGESLAYAIADMRTFWTRDIPEWWNKDVVPWFTAEKWKQLFASITTSLSTTWNSTVTAWKTGISNWWNNDVKPWFTAARWQELGENIKDGIVNGFKGAANGVIDILNKIIAGAEKMVNSVISLINSMLSGYNSVASKLNLPTATLQKEVSFNKLPRLFAGTVVPPSKEFAAILGDNKHEHEVVSPLSTMKQAFIEAANENGGGEQASLLRRAVDLLELLVAKESNVVFAPSAAAGRVIDQSTVLFRGSRG